MTNFDASGRTKTTPFLWRFLTTLGGNERIEYFNGRIYLSKKGPFYFSRICPILKILTSIISLKTFVYKMLIFIQNITRQEIFITFQIFQKFKDLVQGRIDWVNLRKHFNDQVLKGLHSFLAANTEANRCHLSGRILKIDIGSNIVIDRKKIELRTRSFKFKKLDWKTHLNEPWHSMGTYQGNRTKTFLSETF